MLFTTAPVQYKQVIHNLGKSQAISVNFHPEAQAAVELNKFIEVIAQQETLLVYRQLTCYASHYSSTVEGI